MISNQSLHNRALQSLVGTSEWTERTHQRILDAATMVEPVLISGSNGPGRELIARQIHAHSVRADRPFIPFRSCRLPARLVVQQLFGHATGRGRLGRGASLGAFGAADGGTLYIDEVAELSLDAQAKLVDAIVMGRVEQTDTSGERQEGDCDVRLIAYSSKNLLQRVEKGTFNEDLFCLLGAIHVEALPLERRIDQLLSVARKALASLDGT